MKKEKLSTTQIISLGFFVTVIIGAFLLILPISSASGEWTSFIDALFTSTTSVCVTGLVVVPTATYWSVFGQSVILILIQIGGLGIIAITSAFLLMLNRKINLKDAVLLENAFNLDSLDAIVPFLKRVFLFTFCIEFIFFLLYLPIFINDFDMAGIRYALFHSVSAFCNAGIDIIGETSLYEYRGHIMMNILTMLEIALGGIGFIVMFDIKKNLFSRKSRSLKRLSLHTKLVLLTTVTLIFGGAALFFIFEYSNPETIGNSPLGEKILASLFQSVTTRTAGFASIPQSGLLPESVLLSCMLMFIGGSPVGTAGGIKTTTVAVLLMSVAATLKNKKDTVIANRRISAETIKKATSVFVVAILVVLFACLIMFILTDFDALDVTFEVASALGTAGLTRDLTPLLPASAKLTIAVCMFLGRIGPISLVMFFSKKHETSAMRFAEENITVG